MQQQRRKSADFDTVWQVLMLHGCMQVMLEWCGRAPITLAVPMGCSRLRLHRQLPSNSSSGSRLLTCRFAAVSGYAGFT